MRSILIISLMSLFFILLFSCSATDFDTPSCSGEPSEDQLSKYICAECDGYKFLQVVCNNGHLDCPIEARGKEFYKVVKYEDWKGARGDCIMSQ